MTYRYEQDDNLTRIVISSPENTELMITIDENHQIIQIAHRTKNDDWHEIPNTEA